MSPYLRRGDHPLLSHAFDFVARLAETRRVHLSEVFSGSERETALAAASELVGHALTDSQATIRTHGRRVEEMFGYMVTALGAAQAIKREDAGDVLIDGPEDIAMPDYRIVLRDGREILVEVKNCHRGPPGFRFRAKTSYLQCLASYGQVFARPAYLAIYWSRWRVWTLHDVSVLLAGAKGSVVHLSFLNAFRASEMSLLGDMMLATRYPLILRCGVDAALVSRAGDTSSYHMTIRDVEMSCAGVPVLSERDQAIAFGIMAHGRWRETEEVIMDGDRLTAVQFRFEPADPDPNHAFAMVGTLSFLASAAFNELTVDEKGIRRLRTRVLPAPPYPRADERYHGEDLPLWCFIQQSDSSLPVDDEQVTIHGDGADGTNRMPDSGDL